MTNNKDVPAVKKKMGRPPLSKDEPTVRLNASLTVSQYFFLKDYGDNNASRGIQRLVDEKRMVGVSFDEKYASIAQSRLQNEEETDA